MVCLREPFQQGFWGTFRKALKGEITSPRCPHSLAKIEDLHLELCIRKENPKNDPTETAVACENNKGTNLNDPAFILRWSYSYLFFIKKLLPEPPNTDQTRTQKKQGAWLWDWVGTSARQKIIDPSICLIFFMPFS
jgi:hypothetical protein